MARKKRLKFNVSDKDKWQAILKEVQKDEAPINLLRSIEVTLIDGSIIDLDVQDMLRSHKPEELEILINQRLDLLDSMIEKVDFVISIDKISEIAESSTAHILRNIK